MALEYNIIIKGGNKAFEVFEQLNKINDMSAKINKIYEQMGNTTLTKMDKKMKDIKKSTEDVNDKFNMLKEIMTGNFSGAMSKLQGKVKTTFGKTFDTISAGFKSGTMGIKGMIGAITTSLGPLLLALAAVVAAVFVLKRMWQINFLNMQTGYTKFIGELKSMWGKFSAFFTKYLRSIEPIAKIVLLPLITTVKMLWTILKGVFAFFSAAFGPIFDTISEIGAAFKGISGDGKGMQNILDGILWVFKAIGKVVGFLFKMIFTPIKYLWLGVAEIIKKIQGAFTTLVDSRPFKILKMIVEGIKIAFDTVFGGKSTQTSPAAQAGITNNRTVSMDNRNQKIIFNTSRATSPEQSQQFVNILAKQLS